MEEGLTVTLLVDLGLWQTPGGGSGQFGGTGADPLRFRQLTMNALRAKLEVTTRATVVLSTPFEHRPLLHPVPGPSSA